MLQQSKQHVNYRNAPDDYGICDLLWIDESSLVLGDANAFFKLDDWEHNLNNLVSTIFMKQWTAGNDLFHGWTGCRATFYNTPEAPRYYYDLFEM